MPTFSPTFSPLSQSDLTCKSTTHKLSHITHTYTHSSQQPFAELYLQSFNRMLEEGNVDLYHVRRACMAWRAFSCMAGSDVTLGVADVILKKTNLGLIDLEDPSALLLDRPPHVR